VRKEVHGKGDGTPGRTLRALIAGEDLLSCPFNDCLSKLPIPFERNGFHL